MQHLDIHDLITFITLAVIFATACVIMGVLA